MLSKWEAEPPPHIILNVILNGLFVKKGSGSRHSGTNNWREIEKEMEQQFGTKPTAPMPKAEDLWGPALKDFPQFKPKEDLPARNRRAAALRVARERGLRLTEIAA